MFDKKFSYKLSNPIKTQTVSENGEKKAEFYKIKVGNKKIPYIIRLDYFELNVVFIKFYHSKYSADKDKFKHRYNNNLPLTRIVSTCILLCEKKINKNPELLFFFYGQWDNKDVERKLKISQRFKLYSTTVVSKIDQNKYKHLKIEKLNVHGFIPTTLYNKQLENDLVTYFDKLFGDKIQELIIP